MIFETAAFSWLKAKGWALGLAALAVIAPIKAVLITALILVAIDSLTGVWAAMKRGERITSAGFRRTVTKGLVYTIAILTAHLAGVFLFAGAIPLVALVAGAIGLVEAKSIFENLSVIQGQNLFKIVVDRLGSQNDKRPPE